MRPDEAHDLLVAELARPESTRDGLQRDGLSDESQRAAAGELADIDEHVADVASDTFEREVELGLLHTLDAEVEDVRSAIIRLALGAYGRCASCGTPIDDARLRAMPAATRCVEHQRAAERDDDAAGTRGADRSAGLEAAAHLDLLPSEEPQAWAVPAEEAAMHIVEPR